MATRRHHRKSRGGCVACKKKHIKCDERRPQCLNCFKRSISCTYIDAPSPSYPSSTYPSPIEDSQEPQPSSSSKRARVYSAEDLELLHHYCAKANASVSQSIGLSAERGLFELPKLAFESDYVLHAIIGLAALHRAHLEGETGQISDCDFTALAADHVNAALPSYRSALQNITESNCASLLMFASLLSLYVFASSNNGLNPFQKNTQSAKHGSGLSLVSWLGLIVGGMTAIRPWYWHILHNTEYGPCLQTQLWTIQKKPESPLQIHRDGILAGLERLWSEDRRLLSPGSDINSQHPWQRKLSPEQRTKLSTILEALRKAYLWITFVSPGSTDPADPGLDPNEPSAHENQQNKLSNYQSALPMFITMDPELTTYKGSRVQASPIELSAILQFLHSLDGEFEQLLHDKHPYALVILAYYSVLLKQKDVWWIRGVGDDMFAWISEELADEHNIELFGEDLTNWINWPRSVFVHEFDSRVDAGNIEVDLSL
ncbi:hypothetical protein BU24DRAFT_495146 [Aaosphaeria arxii CBS 175.79]|uniref:Zn(2)-C6 fungal-type domain-containing protein n=1 Tax=Aaosphaeria arxii CBS 175.79 TaxID=1450172 RepID=A0A6A5XIC4_9PLEO|nr:uncharacterized protein BU24DRAFT_495146 [Aaosphaeria arxii CBS 175.79]KAF2012064.1 hypothetical protein BU24DRAFT_495146 [Aaosphaeria arxii CBS 175.79]